MISLRPATPEDAAAIAHIHVRTWQATYPGIVPQPYLDALEEAAFTAGWQGRLPPAASVAILLAELDGNPVGFASGGPLRDLLAPYTGELYALYLLPHAQRHGLGRRLVLTIADLLREQGHTHMLLWVLRDNPAAAFYRHLGGTLVTEKTIEIGGAHLPELAFGWPLSGPALAPTPIPAGDPPCRP